MRHKTVTLASTLALTAVLFTGCSSPENQSQFHDSDVTYTLNSSTDVDQSQVISGLKKAGVPDKLVPDFQSVTNALAKRESGQNPNAVNLFDAQASNSVTTAADGKPSQSPRGYLQVIPGTFSKFHVPGTSSNIYDVEANVASAWVYVSNTQGVNLNTGEGLYQFSQKYGIS